MKHTRSSCLKLINLPRLPEVSKFSERRTPGNKPDDLGLKERVLMLSPNIRERERERRERQASIKVLHCHLDWHVSVVSFLEVVFKRNLWKKTAKFKMQSRFPSRNRFGDKSEGAVLKGCGYGPNCFSTTGDPEAIRVMNINEWSLGDEMVHWESMTQVWEHRTSSSLLFSIIEYIRALWALLSPCCFQLPCRKIFLWDDVKVRLCQTSKILKLITLMAWSQDPQITTLLQPWKIPAQSTPSDAFADLEAVVRAYPPGLAKYAKKNAKLKWKDAWWMFVFACAFVQTKQHGLGRTCRTVGPHSLLHSFASFYILHTSRLFVQAFPVG